MFVFDKTLAAIRFGTGLSPVIAPPADIDAMMAALSGPDQQAVSLPITPFSETEPNLIIFRAASRAAREARGTPQEEATKEASRAIRREAQDVVRHNELTTLARQVSATDAMRERLVAFWADHFTALARAGNQRHLITGYVEEAIRPHVTGRFADMLRAVVTHPMMLLYLEQAQSIGPNSPLGLQQGKGLNENLARELLELHTLGAGGSYTQADVRQMAELLAGLTYQAQRGFFFDDRRAEPGVETVLGVSYGQKAGLHAVYLALDNIAAHPDTSEYLARQIAAYFTADTPDPGLVAVMAQAYRENDGALLSVYQAMLSHPVAWAPARAKIKPPFDFIASALRALGLPAADVIATTPTVYRQRINHPMLIMGQPWESALGPDGWPDDSRAWAMPQGMAVRINWSLSAPLYFLDTLPDPRVFVRTALGDSAPDDVVFAASAAGNRRIGVGVILASAAFQRR